jgi:hypothetical protein
VQQFDKENDGVKGYGYRYEYRSSDVLVCPWMSMKMALAETTDHPGWALEKILEGQLRHMIHIDPGDTDEALPDHVKNPYAIDFNTQALLVSTKQSGKQPRPRKVSSQEISKTKLEAFKRETRKTRMFRRFCMLDDSKVQGAEKLKAQGPSW